jgi:hypothetical protein
LIAEDFKGGYAMKRMIGRKAVLAALLMVLTLTAAVVAPASADLYTVHVNATGFGGPVSAIQADLNFNFDPTVTTVVTGVVQSMTNLVATGIGPLTPTVNNSIYNGIFPGHVFVSYSTPDDRLILGEFGFPWTFTTTPITTAAYYVKVTEGHYIGWLASNATATVVPLPPAVLLLGTGLLGLVGWRGFRKS